jgi:UDP-glucose 4-epimerase
MMSYRSQRTLVIGGLGFMGAHLTSALVRAGASVTALTPSRARYLTTADAFTTAGVQIVEGDVRDLSTVRRVVLGQEVVFNLSGQSGAVRSMEDPWSDLDVNLRGNLVLLEALREVNRAARLVFVGSRLQYGRPTKLPVPETEMGHALCVHAIHKQTVEAYLELYARLFGLRYAVARVTNPYGPGQPQDRTAYGVVNRLIHLAIADGTLPIYGDGLQQRDYVHVEDVTAALLALGAMDAASGRAYNVGSGTGTRIIDMARLIIDTAGGGRVAHVPWPALAAEVETGDFVADITRIERELGWSPKIPLRDGVERTVAFYRAHAA